MQSCMLEVSIKDYAFIHGVYMCGQNYNLIVKKKNNNKRIIEPVVGEIAIKAPSRCEYKSELAVDALNFFETKFNINELEFGFYAWLGNLRIIVPFF